MTCCSSFSWHSAKLRTPHKRLARHEWHVQERGRFGRVGLSQLRHLIWSIHFENFLQLLLLNLFALATLLLLPLVPLLHAPLPVRQLCTATNTKYNHVPSEVWVTVFSYGQSAFPLVVQYVLRLSTPRAAFRPFCAFRLMSVASLLPPTVAVASSADCESASAAQRTETK